MKIFVARNRHVCWLDDIAMDGADTIVLEGCSIYLPVHIKCTKLVMQYCSLHSGEMMPFQVGGGAISHCMFLGQTQNRIEWN